MIKRVLSIAAYTAMFSVWPACKGLPFRRDDLTASLRTDSSFFTVRETSGAYFAKIPFVYVNTTPGPVAKAGCNMPPLPELLKKVGDRWVPAYLPMYLACLTKPDFSMPSGGTYRGVLDFLAYKPGQHMGPELRVESIDGVYRLEWDFVEGTDTEVKGARIVKAVSNEFRMVLSQ
jgi:hypothetical protein